MKPEYKVLDRMAMAMGHGPVMLHRRLIFNARAEFANQLVEHWGMVAGIENGEDSSGRAKLRLATPAEIVDRAIATTNLLFEAFEKQDWLTILPTLEEINQQIEQNAKKDR